MRSLFDRAHLVGLCTGVVILLLGAGICFSDTGATEEQQPLGEFLSRVCLDGRDEDWRSEGPVLVLTSEWPGGRFPDEANFPAAQTPFVLYGDGTVIAGALGRTLEGWVD